MKNNKNKQYLYSLFLSTGHIIWFSSNKKVLIKDYKEIVNNIMREISIENDDKEPYIVVNDNFFTKLFDKMKVYGFEKNNSRTINYDVDNLTIL